MDLMEQFAWKHRQIGREEGLEEARRELEARREGRREGQAVFLADMLEYRFGALPAEVRARILSAHHTMLRAWAARVLTAPDLESVFFDWKAGWQASFTELLDLFGTPLSPKQRDCIASADMATLRGWLRTAVMVPDYARKDLGAIFKSTPDDAAT